MNQDPVVILIHSKKIQAVNYSLVQINIEIYKTKIRSPSRLNRFLERIPFVNVTPGNFARYAATPSLARAELFLTNHFFVLSLRLGKPSNVSKPKNFLSPFRRQMMLAHAAPVHSDFRHASGTLACMRTRLYSE